MNLLTLYCNAADVHYEPLAVKHDAFTAVVVAFDSDVSAKRYMDLNRYDPDLYDVKELTIDEFLKKRDYLRKAIPGIEVFIQVNA